MDIKKKKNKASYVNAKLAGYVFALVALSSAALLVTTSGDAKIERSNIVVGTVRSGDIDITVEGYGTLLSNKKQLLTTSSQTTVKNILLKPGAKVSANSIIVVLENSQLVRNLEKARNELKKSEADLRQLKLNHLREKLNENDVKNELDAQYQTISLKRTAEKLLLRKGVIADLDFKTTMIIERQLEKKIETFKEKETQLTNVHREEVYIQEEKIKQNRLNVEIAKEQADKLIVRAGFDGVLQRLSVELGQSLPPGQEIGLIGSMTDLVAIIRVPQNQSHDIKINQKAIIDTRQDKIEGYVIRIDPVVTDNSVFVEISLDNNLPASALPDLSIDGTIVIETIKDVMYIEKPTHVNPNSSVEVFYIDETMQTAQRRPVVFGRKAGRYIEVISNAKKLDRFILSEIPVAFRKESKLKIY